MFDWLLGFFNWFFPPISIKKVPKNLAVASADFNASAVFNFFSNFPDIENIEIFSPKLKEGSGKPLDLLIIHDPQASASFLSIPDFVPRESISYAELIPVGSLQDSALAGALAAFSAKSQRFGR